jgi:hypothetical protein
MALPVTIPNEFANATASIPLSQLDSNFSTLANVVNQINAGTQQLSNANVAILIVNAGTSAAPTITTTGDTNTGIFFPAADTIAFTEGGAEAMRIDASGNLGLGVTPSAWNALYKAVQLPFGAILTGRTDTPETLLAANTYRDSGGFKYFGTGNATAYFQTGGVHSWQISASGTADNAISFTQAMTLDASGNLLVGTTSLVSGVERLCVVNPSGSGDWNSVFSNPGAAPFGIFINYSAVSPNNTGRQFISGTDSTANRFQIRSNGGIANYTANDVNLSDRREKTNFAPAKNYLETICAIPVQTFNYIDQNLEDDPGLTLGVVAQDVQEVAPEFVMESNWGTQEEPKMRLSIYQTDLQYALMKCVQELKAELDTVKAELATLKGQA